MRNQDRAQDKKCLQEIESIKLAEHGQVRDHKSSLEDAYVVFWGRNVGEVRILRNSERVQDDDNGLQGFGTSS